MNADSMSSDPNPAEGAVATGSISAVDPARRLRMPKPAVCPMCEVPDRYVLAEVTDEMVEAAARVMAREGEPQDDWGPLTRALRAALDVAAVSTASEEAQGA